MSFIWGVALWALVIIPVLIVVYILMQRRRQKFALRYASLSLVKQALGKGPGIRRHIPAILFLIGLASAIFALARPTATIVLPSQQGTVILAMDVSGSMQATDVKPTRLDAAKAAAVAFVNNQPKDVRIGVVSFSDTAYLVQSPTTDRASVLNAINQLFPLRSTAIGSGILTSLYAITGEQPPIQSFSQRGSFLLPQPTLVPTPTPVPPGTYAHAVIVLLSDGESNAGPNPLDVVDQAANRGIRIFTVGLGSPEGVVLSIQGRSIRVRLDEATLKQIAQATGGRYYKAGSETDLHDIYQSLGSQLVFKSEKTELTVFFTGGATAFLLLAGALSLLWFTRLP